MKGYNTSQTTCYIVLIFRIESTDHVIYNMIYTVYIYIIWIIPNKEINKESPPNYYFPSRTKRCIEEDNKSRKRDHGKQKGETRWLCE